jgi:hypothetical protein
MSKSNFLAVAIICAATFTSCGVNDDIRDETNQAVHFSASIDNQAVANAPGTRAAGTVWGNDAIGIFMVANGTTTIAENAVNKQYTTAGTSAFTAVSGDEIYYPMDGSKVDFIAYYPYASGKTLGSSISVDVSGAQTASSQADIDLLWAKANGTGGSGYDKVTHATTPVALAFNHKLAKMVINCKAETNTGIVAANFTTATVVINGMNTRTSLTLADGTLSAATGSGVINPNKIATAANFLASYDAIIVPAQYGVAVVRVVFTVNGEPYTWTLNAETFASGNEYTYEVTLTRTGVQVTGTIKPWTPNNGNPGTAE